MKKILGFLAVVGFVTIFLISGRAEGRKVPNLELRSSAFGEDERIPSDFTCDGADMSPPLSWSGAPADTKSLALIVEDPDAPQKDWTHWLLYDLSPTLTQLPAGMTFGQDSLTGGLQGRNDFKKEGYGGPCPPSGVHHYRFKLYALDAKLHLNSGVSKPELLQAMQGHILAEGSLTGTYDRS